MNTPPNPHAAFPSTPSKQNPSFWKKLGGGPLSISLVIHLILGVAGLIWVFQIIPAPQEKDVDFSPSRGGATASSDVQIRKQSQALKPKAARVVALNSTGNLTLPEQSPQMASLGLGDIGGGLGVTGLGGPKGAGSGRVLMPGMTEGLGTGNLFGLTKRNESSLVGTFYDLKQTKKRKPTNIDENQAREVIREFLLSGWKKQKLNDYFSPEVKLHQSKIYIPKINASAVPAAFGCEGEVQPQNIFVVYRGVVSPPKTGRYRFVGGADDVLAVRFNQRMVFDHGYTLATAGITSGKSVPYMQTKTKNPEMEKLMKGSPMKPPVTFYKYDATKTLNSSIGGLAVGPEFEAIAGVDYPIDILIGEIPGGFFSAALLIEEIGVNYPKDPLGSPILPIFRLDGNAPIGDTDDQKPLENVPPYDPNGAAWKLTSQNVPEI